MIYNNMSPQCNAPDDQHLWCNDATCRGIVQAHSRGTSAGWVALWSRWPEKEQADHDGDEASGDDYYNLGHDDDDDDDWLWCKLRVFI